MVERAARLGVGLRLLLADDALPREVQFIAGDRQQNLRPDHLAQLAHPALYPLEAVRVGDVKDQQRGVGVAVVDGAERVEALLAGGVPDDEVDRLVTQPQRASRQLA